MALLLWWLCAVKEFTNVERGVPMMSIIESNSEERVFG